MMRRYKVEALTPSNTDNARPGALLDDRYAIVEEIGCGGMATVYYAMLQGPEGFVRPVAVKRLHPHLCRDRDFVTMFSDEARLSACLKHINIVPTLDVIRTREHTALVMEYVHGITLSELVAKLGARGQTLPTRVACTVVASVLHGLHAAHQARGPSGEPLNMVHRDVSPQNILVGADGIPRILDFGVAKANGRLRETTGHELKGKLRYIAPEQLRNQEVTPIADVYSAGVVLWEALTGSVRFEGQCEANIIQAVLAQKPWPPSRENRDVSSALDTVVVRAMAIEPDQRFPSAEAMAMAIEAAVSPVPAAALANWLGQVAGEELDARAASLRDKTSRFMQRAGTAQHPRRAPEPADTEIPDGHTRRVPRASAHGATATESDAKAVAPAGIDGARRWKRVGWAIGLGAVLSGGLVYQLSGTGLRPATVSASPQPETSLGAATFTQTTTVAAPASVATEGQLTPDVAIETPPPTPAAVDGRGGATNGSIGAPLARTSGDVGDRSSVPKATPGPTPEIAQADAKQTGAARKPGAQKRLKPTAPPATRRKATKAQARKGKPRKAATRAAKAAASCDPPYVVDARGVKRFRVECFGP